MYQSDHNTNSNEHMLTYAMDTNTMNRMMREVVPPYTQAQADTFKPSICPESYPYIVSSVVPRDGSPGEYPRPIDNYYITTNAGALQIYEGAVIYPYHGVDTMFAHVEVLFEEVPIPHESVLKWSALALRAGPISSSARANQLVVVEGNTVHYMWRVLSVEGEANLPTTRSKDITGLHMWRWHPLEVDDLLGAYGRWVCGRVSLSIEPPGTDGTREHILTTSRGTRPIDWDSYTRYVPEHEPVHKLYMALMGESLL